MKARQSHLTQDSVRELRDCDYETGLLTWRSRARHWFASDRSHASFNNRTAGKPALTAPHGGGYLAGIVDGEHILTHRVVFLHYHGYLPPEIDHENGDTTDNRISNLKASDPTGNRHNAKMQSNNTSGVTGVSYVKRTGKFSARIGQDGKTLHLGQFDSLDDAERAVREKRAELGSFSQRHGH